MELFEYLDNQDLGDLEKLIDVFSYNQLRLRAIADEVFVRIPPPKSRMDSLFSFTANSTLAGGPYPCYGLECRMNNVDKLAQFSALYADTVLIPSPFDDFIHEKDVDEGELVLALATLLQLRPLIEEGIVGFAVSDLHLCRDCLRDILATEREFSDVFEPLIEMMSAYYLNNTKLWLECDAQHGAFVRIDGPEKYVAHGRTFIHFRKTPDYVEELLMGRDSVELPRDIVLNRGFLSSLLDPLIQDHTLSNVWLKMTGGTYLTDRELDADLIDLMHSESTRRISSGMVSGLSHLIPMVSDVSLEDIVTFREKEWESFVVYRDAVSQVVKNIKSDDPSVYREAYNDTIRPEVNKITLAMTNSRKGLLKSVKTDLGIWTGLAVLGIYSGLADPTLASVITLFGGAGFAKDVYKNLRMANEEPASVRDNPYYFLWKMSQR